MDPLGQSLGLSYSEGQGGHQMFNTTLMEPSAYRHFIETGEFRDGTMLAAHPAGHWDECDAGASGAVRN